MLGLRYLTSAVFIILALVDSTTRADPVKAFVPEKPWQITINLDKFEPWDLLDAKTILGGSTKDGIRITIIAEKTKPGTKPSEIRKLYGQRSLTGFGQARTAEQLDVNDIAVLLFKWAKPNIPKMSEEDAKWAEQAVKDTWSYHGYMIKDDAAFDIHLSADMSKHTKKQMLNIIKSFQIKSSTELEELEKLYGELYKEFNKDLDKNIQVEQRLKLALDFIKKYPTNPEVQVFIGDHYVSTDDLNQAKKYYLKALDNHKMQPFINPTTLWTCYDGLGLSYGMSGEYEPSKQYFESGYKLAKQIEEPYYIASSAYNLACLYAETNDVQNSIKYLTEAVKLNPELKEDAKRDPSFANIKEDQRFKDLIGK